MYAALWRALPGNAAVKAILMILLASGVVVALFEWGFPWLNDLISIYDPVVS